MNKKYSNSKMEDLLQDEYFIQSVKRPTKESELFWKQETDSDASLRNEYETAKSFIEAINVEKKEISEDGFTELWNRIDERNRYTTRKLRLARPVLYAIASCAACVAVILAIFRFSGGGVPAGKQDIVAVANSIREEATSDKVILTLTNKEKIEIDDNNAEIEYSPEGEIAVNTNTVSPAHSTKEVNYNQLTVPLGKRSVLTLSDGTKLWVNAGTKVVYPVTFEGKKREIYIDGEIFIDVTHDPSRPFYVKSEMLHIAVLGTTFNVQAYKSDSCSAVVLVEGSLKVAVREHDITLKPNEKLTMRPEGLNIAPVDVEDYILWKEGLYLFRNEKFGIILKKLSKYYGVELKCDIQAAYLICNGKIDLKEDINRVLTGIAKTVPVELSANGNRYEFRYKKPEVSLNP